MDTPKLKLSVVDIKRFPTSFCFKGLFLMKKIGKMWFLSAITLYKTNSHVLKKMSTQPVQGLLEGKAIFSCEKRPHLTEYTKSW